MANETGNVRLESGKASLTLAPSEGGRAASLTVSGLELLGHNEDSVVGWGSYPMAPWPGKLAANSVTWRGTSHPMPITFDPWALHGLVLAREWHVRSVSADQAVLSVELGQDDGDPWPWPCEIESYWKLADDHLVVLLEARSLGDEMPMELGWHPWFRRRLGHGASAELYPEPGRMYVRDARLLPTGELVPRPAGPYDDCFEVLDGRIGLRWPGALSLELETDCPVAVIYTCLDEVICLEPQLSPPDWINRQPHILSPDAPVSTRTLWRWVEELDS